MKSVLATLFTLFFITFSTIAFAQSYKIDSIIRGSDFNEYNNRSRDYFEGLIDAISEFTIDISEGDLAIVSMEKSDWKLMFRFYRSTNMLKMSREEYRKTNEFYCTSDIIRRINYSEMSVERVSGEISSGKIRFYPEEGLHKPIFTLKFSRKKDENCSSNESLNNEKTENKQEDLKDKKAIENQQRQKQSRQKRIAELQSKVYELKQYYPNEYQKFYQRLQDRIINSLSYHKYSSDYSGTTILGLLWDLIKKEQKNQFSSAYRLSSWTERVRPSGIVGRRYPNSYTSIKTRSKLKKISGLPNRLIDSAIRNANIDLPIIEREGIEITTRVDFDSINIGYIQRGFIIKVKKEEVKFLRNKPEKESTLHLIREKVLKAGIEGKYNVLYESITVNETEKSYIYLNERRSIFVSSSLNVFAIQLNESKQIVKDKEIKNQVEKNIMGKVKYGVTYSLSNRTAISMVKPAFTSLADGIIVVIVEVDKYGKVTKAEPGAKGTTLTDEKFLEAAKEAAYKAKFNTDEDAPAFQQGTISYKFTLD